MPSNLMTLGNGRDDVNEGVDDGSMLGQIKGRELFDMADDGLGHVPGIEQGFRAYPNSPMHR